ncbi:unnamed protein product [Closterium sp. NIES-65]|nr:unnamed protein product [Closterium sp. NIES-65]
MFSLSLRWVDGRTLPLLQYVLSLAVVQAIEDMAKERGTSLPQVALKWPNDIFLGGLKVGGVLCTSSYRNRAFDVTVGIGLNVNNAHPTTCINAALQAACPSAAPVSHEALLAALLNRLHSLLSVFEQQGFKPLEADYLQRWLHSGQHVVLEEAKEGGSVTQVSLTIQGLTTGGYLLATDPSGIQYELSPDGNSLDFFKGLMRDDAPFISRISTNLASPFPSPPSLLRCPFRFPPVLACPLSSAPSPPVFLPAPLFLSRPSSLAPCSAWPMGSLSVTPSRSHNAHNEDAATSPTVYYHQLLRAIKACTANPETNPQASGSPAGLSASSPSISLQVHPPKSTGGGFYPKEGLGVMGKCRTTRAGPASDRAMNESYSESQRLFNDPLQAKLVSNVREVFRHGDSLRLTEPEKRAAVAAAVRVLKFLKNIRGL